MPRLGRKRFRQAANIFRHCPRCNSPNVIRVEGEVICSYCGWESLSIDLPQEMVVSMGPANPAIERTKPGSLAELVDRILGEISPGEPCFA